MNSQPSSDSLVRSSAPLERGLRRSKGLRKLGVSEEDVHLAEKLLGQIPSCPSDPNKAERILGYASTRLARGKAIRTLGTTEEEVDMENAKNLGSLGKAGRRRSFSIAFESSQELLAFTKAIYNGTSGSGSGMSGKTRRHTLQIVKRQASILVCRSYEKRRRSSNCSVDFKHLRKQASQAKEIEALKARIQELERTLAETAVQSPSSNDVVGTSRSPALVA